MDIKVVLEKYGIAGEETIGYLNVTLDKPTTIRSAFVKLSLHSTLYFHCESTFAVHEFDKPNLKSNYSFNSFTDKQDLQLFECEGFGNGLETEYPPGTHQFPFCFTLPKDFQPTLAIPKYNLRSDYFLAGIIETPQNRIVGNIEELPILYNMPDIPQEYEKKTTKFIDDLYIELVQPKQTYIQGETVNVVMNVKSFKKQIPELEILVIGVYNQDTIIFKNRYISFNFTPTSEGYSSPVTFNLPSTIPPSTSTNLLKWKYYISIKPLAKKFIIPQIKKFKFELCFPFNVIAYKPSSIEMAQEYMKSIDKTIIFDSKTIFTPPNYKFSQLTKNATELVEIDNNELVLLDHSKRSVFEIHDDKVIESQIHYPFIESTTLPSGLTYRTIMERECIIDYTNKNVYWTFQQKDNQQTQAEKNDCQRAVVSIELIEGKEIQFPKKKHAPTLFTCVGSEVGKCLKTKENKTTNPIFNDAQFILFPPKKKSNVIVYFYYKRSVKGIKLVGYINIDLTKLPFHSYYESWHQIKSIDTGKNYFQGKIKMRIGYDEEIKDHTDSVIILNEVKETVIDINRLEIEVQKRFATKKLNEQATIANDVTMQNYRTNYSVII